MVRNVRLNDVDASVLDEAEKTFVGGFVFTGCNRNYFLFAQLCVGGMVFGEVVLPAM